MTRDLCYRFDDIEVQRLKLLLDRHGAMLGMRGHYLANAPSPFAREHFDGRTLVDLDHASFHELAPLLRESAVVLTDYRSARPDHLIPEDAFPGTVVYDRAALESRLPALGMDYAALAPGLIPYVDLSAAGHDALREAAYSAIRVQGTGKRWDRMGACYCVVLR